jgi:hypothetical protein
LEERSKLGLNPGLGEGFLPEGRTLVQRKPAIRETSLRQKSTQAMAFSDGVGSFHPKKRGIVSLPKPHPPKPVILPRSYYNYPHF